MFYSAILIPKANIIGLKVNASQRLGFAHFSLNFLAKHFTKRVEIVSVNVTSDLQNICGCILDSSECNDEAFNFN